MKPWRIIPSAGFTISPLSLFTAVVFLNMVIDIVVNVMEEENAKVRALEYADEPTIVDIYKEIQELKRMLKESGR